MSVFSTRFVVLVCLCAAIPFAPAVEAAYLHSSRAMEKHATPPHPPHQTHKPSFFDGSTPAHKHDDEHHDHPKHEHRPVRPPPLLRHYRVHDHKNAHYHDQDTHDHADDKTHRSAFARSRYRQERTRSSSVYVPGEHGNTYVVSGTGQASTEKPYERRQVDGNSLASGRVDIMGATQSFGSTQRLASLAVDSTPIDWMSGQGSAKAFPLNASTTNRTQFIMVPTNDSDTRASLNRLVKLATQVFDAGSADMVMYCATYNSNPGTPSALLMTPCSDAALSTADDETGPCTGDQEDASSSKSRQSQIFSYDPFSGVIEPISSTGASADTSSSDISASCAGAKVRRDTGNSTMSGSGTPTSTSMAPTPSTSQRAQNVTLVYVAGALEVPPLSSSSGLNSTASSTPTPSAHMNQAAVVTTTVTTTVVTTVTASGTVSPAEAVASVQTSLSASASSRRSSLGSSSTTSARATPTTTADADESLEVEVVGVAPSTTTSSSSTLLTSTSTTPSPSHSTTSTTPSAEGMASLVVEQMPHRRSIQAVASASVM